MKQTYFFFLSLSVLGLCCTPEPSYDIIIKNGLIYDGTGAKPYMADIAINADTIAKIGNISSTSQLIIDAEGQAVAPGFINMLSWANESLIQDGRSQSDIRQGVTLEVMGEGRSMGPLNEAMKKNMINNQSDFRFEVPWNTLGEYLRYIEGKGISTNIASFVGNGTIREYVMGYDTRKPSSDEMEQMRQLVDQSMREGAVGISSSLLYAPSINADTEELIELSKVVSPYGGMYISHIRDESEFLIKSIEELITIARQADVPAEVYHLKASGQKNWNKLDSAIMLINKAREEGLEITADMYTYPASSTGLHVQLPEWVRIDGVGAAIEKLKDPTTRNKVVKELIFSNPPESILLVGFRNPELRHLSGKRLSEVAADRNLSPENTLIDLLIEDNSRIQVVYFSMSEENIEKKIQLPWMSFCSDAGSYSAEGDFLKQSTHPRAYGSFIRVLGKYSRDRNLFSLEEGIRRLTSLPASNLKIQKRGMLKEGYFGDIVIFDPEKVNDKATFEQPHQYAEGINHVLVNGVQVINNGIHTGATPGRFIKGPGYRNKDN